MPPPRPKSVAKIRAQQEATNKTGGASSFTPTQVLVPRGTGFKSRFRVYDARPAAADVDARA